MEGMQISLFRKILLSIFKLNPNLEILEGRIALWDEAEMSACFESGMAAITTVILEFLKPGDLLLYSRPVYGGTDFFINKILPKWGNSFNWF